MRRGDVVLVVVPGDYGKPRPAVVVQTDLVNDTHSSKDRLGTFRDQNKGAAKKLKAKTIWA